MQRKRHCAPLSEMELGVTIEGMVPRTDALDVVIYIISIIGAAVLFFFKL